jgi:hypothetical protein
MPTESEILYVLHLWYNNRIEDGNSDIHIDMYPIHSSVYMHVHISTIYDTCRFMNHVDEINRIFEAHEMNVDYLLHFKLNDYVHSVVVHDLWRRRCKKIRTVKFSISEGNHTFLPKITLSTLEKLSSLNVRRVFFEYPCDVQSDKSHHRDNDKLMNMLFMPSTSGGSLSVP